jgi:hypothetical protein
MISIAVSRIPPRVVQSEKKGRPIRNTSVDIDPQFRLTDWMSEPRVMINKMVTGYRRLAENSDRFLYRTMPSPGDFQCSRFYRIGTQLGAQQVPDGWNDQVSGAKNQQASGADE